MSTHKKPEDPAQLEASRKARYELRDGDFWAVGKAINGFFIFTAVSFALAFVAMLLISPIVNNLDRPVNSTVMNEPKVVPKIAPLQNNVTAWRDMVELRERERVATQTYGEVEGKPGKVRIPVDRAMEKLAAGGRSAIITGGTNP
jgi:hypothetical protein